MVDDRSAQERPQRGANRPALFITANARPRRFDGVRSESVVNMRPVFPSDRLIKERPSTKTQRFPASTATIPAKRYTTNERKTSGLRA